MTSLPTRRELVALAAVLALPASARAEEADKVKVMAARRVFPYLERFLRLPPDAHDRFVLAYYALANGRPAINLRLTFMAGADQWIIPVAADGLIGRLPTLQELREDAQVRVEGPGRTTLTVRNEVHPTFPLAAEIDAADVRAALGQITSASRRVAGPFGFAVPRLDRAEFHGVGSGEAIYADGRVAPLRLFNGNPYFDSEMTWVKRLRFPRAPDRIELEPKD